MEGEIIVEGFGEIVSRRVDLHQEIVLVVSLGGCLV